MTTDVQTSVGGDTEQVIAEVREAMYTDSGRLDPYPHYRRLQEIGPILVAPDGLVLITGYAEQAEFLKDHRFTKHPERRLEANGWPNWRDVPSLRMMFEGMLFLNPPDHTRLRRLVAAAFTPRRVLQLRPVVQKITDDMLDALPRGTRVNFVKEFAFPMPIAVVGALLGVPQKDWGMFQELAADWTIVMDDLSPETVAKADISANTMTEYFVELAKEKEKRPTDDVISVMVAAQGDRVTPQELVTMAALMLVAGFETTSGLLAKGLHSLMVNPEQADRLRTDPEITASAVEEILRYDAPVQLVVNRVAEGDTEVAGVPIAARQPVLSIVGQGNRDPRVFSRPDELILDRQEGPSISFGGGVHYCIGASLARLESEVVFPTVLRRFPDIAMAAERTPRRSLVISGLEDMPVTL